MSIQRYYFLILFTLFFILTGCENKSTNEVPGYLEIDEIKLTHENAIGITDAWVYVNGNIQGVYELPAKFPVLSDGAAEVNVYSGIKVNGIAATRIKYPFYETYSKTITFKPGEVVKINPQSSYQQWAQVIVIDDFEYSEPKFIPGTTTDTVLVKTNSSFEGNYAGAVYLDEDNPLFNASSYSVNIPDFTEHSSGIYLEMNFKSNVFLEVGVIAKTYEPIIYLSPTDKWKKIYIDLYDSLVFSNEDDKFVIYFQAQLGDEMTSATILIDDIKIVS